MTGSTLIPDPKHFSGYIERKLFVLFRSSEHASDPRVLVDPVHIQKIPQSEVGAFFA